ncbi:MAG TPA: alpha/beta hydrolase-fold protein [Pyrinomonadaceae bacterium]|jgi:predicted alpha/beta superfamily hydrolase|nr:alpha/beta hydrolase-fold protein [Pyrinomonadaceae bacterium]
MRNKLNHSANEAGRTRRLRLVNAALLAVLAVLLTSSSASAQAPNLYDAPEQLVIKSQVLGEERTILVRTPAGYARSSEHFPVLYMTDGDAHIQHTSSTISFLARNARMPEMIVVGITNTDRTRDLTPTRVERVPGNPNAPGFPTSGGADKFLKFIETELIPLVESKYRTQPFRALAGHSLGGLFAVHALVTKPELFNSYIAVSPSLQWDNFGEIDRVKEFFKTRKELNRTLFTSLGNEPGDIGDAFGLFRDELQRQQVKGFVWEAAKYDDEDHGSVVLRSHYAGLRKVFDGWQFPRDSNTGAVAGGLKGVEEHYHKLSERLGFTVLVPEALMNQVGYQLIGQGNTEEAVAAFKLNVERYPGSANVYDSLGEAYERTGRFELALTNYEKAHTVGQRANDPNVNIYKTNLDRMAARAKQGGVEAKQ